MNSWHSGEQEAASEQDMVMFASVTTEYRIMGTEPKPTPVPEEVDRRYRIQVLLQRSDRPTNWKFFCPHCQSPIKDVEIINAEIESMSDMVNMADTASIMVGYRCPGRYCRYWYYFKVN